jgi:transformation/transcription domain-associated protein
MIYVKRAAMRAMTANQAQVAAQISQPQADNNQPAQTEIKDVTMSEANTENAQSEGKKATLIISPLLIHAPNGTATQSTVQSTAQSETATASVPLRGAWDHIEEVNQILKTAFPLLILCMETLVDQINSHFKVSGEEDIYRLICMLMQDAIQVRWLLLLVWTHPKSSVRITF